MTVVLVGVFCFAVGGGIGVCLGAVMTAAAATDRARESMRATKPGLERHLPGSPPQGSSHRSGPGEPPGGHQVV